VDGGGGRYAEPLADLSYRAHERVDLVLVVVDPHRRSNRRRFANPLRERLRAMMPCAHADLLRVEELRHVVRVHAFDGETHRTAAPRNRRTEHHDTVER
jgi:hypothetical protein